jgi:hypothetical protein
MASVNQSTVTTDSNSLVQEAAVKYYNNRAKALEGKTVVEKKDVNFIKYGDLVEAVTGMERKGNNVICRGKKCRVIVQKMRKGENQLAINKKLGVINLADSVLIRIMKGIMRNAGFVDDDGQPINIETNSNLFKDDLYTSYGFTKKKIDFSGGGTLRARVAQKAATRRLRNS